MILRALSRRFSIGRQLKQQRIVPLRQQQPALCACEPDSQFSSAARQVFRAPSRVLSLRETYSRAAKLPLFRIVDERTLLDGDSVRIRRHPGIALSARRLLEEPRGSKLPGILWQRGILVRNTDISLREMNQVRGVKTKIKPYSSWKKRFRITSSGEFQRKQKGKRHKAFSKSPKQRMRLRAMKLVHATLEKPMRKLGYKLR